jgi:hypothetical protein
MHKSAKQKEPTSEQGFKNSINFFGIVLTTLIFLGFLFFYKFNAMAVSDLTAKRAVFCDNLTLIINTADSSQKISCDNWIDVSDKIAKIDGISITLGRGNALVFNLDENSKDIVRVVAEGAKTDDCLNIQPDYEGGVYRMITGTCTKDSGIIDYSFKFVNADPAIAEKFGFPKDAITKNLLFTTIDAIAIDGIFDKSLVVVSKEKEEVLELNASIPEFNLGRNCKGCLMGSVCVGLGKSVGNNYCDFDKVIKQKKGWRKSCENSFECLSNSCRKKCGFYSSFWEWLKSLFLKKN